MWLLEEMRVGWERAWLGLVVGAKMIQEVGWTRRIREVRSLLLHGVGEGRGAIFWFCEN